MDTVVTVKTVVCSCSQLCCFAFSPHSNYVMSSRDWLPGRHCALHPGTRLHSSTRAMHPWVKTNDTETDDIFVCSYTVRQSKIQDGLIPPCTQNFSGMGGLYTRNQCNLNTLYMAKSVTLLERWLYQ